MQIKICGLKRPEDVDYVNQALPDYAGFLFWEKSRRFVTEEQAENLKKNLDGRIKAVGVFVDETPARIVRLLQKGIIDIAQLHGQETETEIRQIREQSGKPVWKAVIVRDAADVRRWRNSEADMLLFDGGKGEGNAFCWDYLSNLERPFFLAGGMNLERIKKAESIPYLAGIDVSSSVETDGCKDRDKILQMVQSVRTCKSNKGKAEV